MMFAEKLKQLRKNAGVSQLKMHLDTGIANSAIQQYEKGVRLPLEDNCQKIANYFKIDAQALYRLVDKERCERK